MDEQKNGNMKKRLLYAAAFFLLFLIELLIALYVRDSFIRPYVGDALVTILICFFVRIFIPCGVSKLPFYVFLFAAAVEVSQYFNLVELLSLQQYPVVRTVLGMTFDVKDIVCYGVGCLLFWLLENKNLISSGRGA